MLTRRRPVQKDPQKPAPKSARAPRTEPPVHTAEALRGFAEKLSAGFKQYTDARDAIVEREAKLLWTILDAVGANVAAVLCSLPERAVSPIRVGDTSYVALVNRADDHVVLWEDGTLALVPYDGAPVHYTSPKDFVERVGIGFARAIAQAIGREVKRAAARLPTLISDLTTYAATLPSTEPAPEPAEE